MAIKPINFEIIVNDFIKALNKQSKTESNKEIYGIAITVKNKIKELKLYSVNEDTGERTIMYKNAYEVKNSAEFIKRDINYILYRELFYNMFAFYAVNMEAIIKQRLAEQAVNNLVPGGVKTSLATDEAFSKALREAEVNS